MTGAQNVKSSVETLPDSMAKLTVEVPLEELKPAIDKAYKNIASQINIPGFRKGHIPPRLIDQRIGKGAVYEEAINSQLQKLYTKAVEEVGVHPLMSPSISLEHLPIEEDDKNPNVVFTAEVCVRPEFETPGFDGITLDVEPAEITDDDLQQALEDLRLRFATLKPVERKAKKGDFVTIDLAAAIEGKEVDSVSGISYEIGAGNMIDGIDKALTGLSVGDSKSFKTTLEGGPHKGEEADVTVVLQAVKVRELPEVDDDFAQLVSEFDTVEELREDLEKQVKADKSLGQVLSARTKIIEYIINSTDLEVPEQLVEAEISRSLEARGLSLDSDEAGELRTQIGDTLREQIVLDSLSEEFEIEVSQEDLMNFMVDYATRSHIDPSEFIQQAVKNGQLPEIYSLLAREKVVEIALAKATITDGAQEIDLSEHLSDGALEASKNLPAKKASSVIKKTAAKKTAKTAAKASASKKETAAEKEATAEKDSKPASKRATTRKSSKSSDSDKAETKPATSRKTASKKNSETDKADKSEVKESEPAKRSSRKTVKKDAE